MSSNFQSDVIYLHEVNSLTYCGFSPPQSEFIVKLSVGYCKCYVHIHALATLRSNVHECIHMCLTINKRHERVSPFINYPFTHGAVHHQKDLTRLLRCRTAAIGLLHRPGQDEGHPIHLQLWAFSTLLHRASLLQ